MDLSLSLSFSIHHLQTKSASARLRGENGLCFLGLRCSTLRFGVLYLSLSLSPLSLPLRFLLSISSCLWDKSRVRLVKLPMLVVEKSNLPTLGWCLVSNICICWSENVRHTPAVFLGQSLTPVGSLPFHRHPDLSQPH